jgi:hypothetical protein
MRTEVRGNQTVTKITVGDTEVFTFRGRGQMGVPSGKDHVSKSGESGEPVVVGTEKVHIIKVKKQNP